MDGALPPGKEKKINHFFPSFCPRKRMAMGLLMSLASLSQKKKSPNANLSQPENKRYFNVTFLKKRKKEMTGEKVQSYL